METGANIVRRYANSEPVERIDIICAHYENFTSIIDSFEVGVFHLISCEKAYNRQKRKGDLGVRIQDGKGHSDPTAKQAVENVMIMEAIRGCDFSGDLLKDTENAEEHRRDILTIQMMREEFDVFDAHLRALKRKGYRMMHSYLIGEKEMQDMQDRDSRHLYDIAKLLPEIKITPELDALIDDVRDDRMQSKNNPAAQLEHDIPAMLKGIISSRFYESDYNNITKKLLYENVSYEEAISKGISQIADMDIFKYKK